MRNPNKLILFIILISFSVVAYAQSPKKATKKKLVIAHRGACGYLPEHTLEAKAMAYAMGVDYIEQDVVMTKDNHLVVLHDIHLDTVTNVVQLFPKRARSDQRYYAIDFTLAEIKTLKVQERIHFKTKKAVFPKRFPLKYASFKIPSLAEEIELIQGLNKSFGKDVGIYVEIKSPQWHQKEGKDISKRVLELLKQYGYKNFEDKAYIQCFDPSTLERLRWKLKTKLRLVQLMAPNRWKETGTNLEKLLNLEGMTKIATYANGVGFWINQIIPGVDAQGKPIITSLVNDAHLCGLEVHPYTFRADSLPPYVSTLEELLRIFYFEIGVDGVFTDFPDRAVQLVRAAGY